MRIGLSVVRAIVGLLFVGHGTQKLFGWFGGHGPEGTGQFFESIGLRPGKPNALAAGTSEAVGGALLATGLATPLAAAALTGTMATAIQTVHGAKGVWVSDGGFEYNLVLIAAVLAITDETSGRGWALAELLAGLAGSAAVVTLARQVSDGAETPA